MSYPRRHRWFRRMTLGLALASVIFAGRVSEVLLESFLGDMHRRPVSPGADRLTSREREIVRLVALGLHNTEIAQRLSISEVTVKTHINNVFHKLDARDRVGLTLYAIRLGLIGVDEKGR